MRNMVLLIDTNVLLNYILNVEAITPSEFLQLLRKMDFQ